MQNLSLQTPILKDFIHISSAKNLQLSVQKLQYLTTQVSQPFEATMSLNNNTLSSGIRIYKPGALFQTRVFGFQKC